MTKNKVIRKVKNRFGLEVSIHGDVSKGQSASTGGSQWNLYAETIEDLRAEVSKLQKDNDYGAGNWGEAKVFNVNELIGFMSFDGRIWKELFEMPKKVAPAKVKTLIIKKIASGLRGKTKAEKASKKSILSKIEIMMPND